MLQGNGNGIGLAGRARNWPCRRADRRSSDRRTAGAECRLSLGLPLGSLFFAQEVVIWKGFMDNPADGFLGRQVGFGDQIVSAPFHGR